MEGEIVTTVPENTQINEIEKSELSVGDSQTPTLVVRQKLEEKGYGIDRLLDMAIDVAEHAMSHPKGEGGTDYGKKLKAIEMLLEASGYVKRKNGVELKFSLSKLLYSKN